MIAFFRLAIVCCLVNIRYIIPTCDNIFSSRHLSPYFTTRFAHHVLYSSSDDRFGYLSIVFFLAKNSLSSISSMTGKKNFLIISFTAALSYSTPVSRITFYVTGTLVQFPSVNLSYSKISIKCTLSYIVPYRLYRSSYNKNYRFVLFNFYIMKHR